MFGLGIYLMFPLTLEVFISSCNILDKNTNVLNFTDISRQERQQRDYTQDTKRRKTDEQIAAEKKELSKALTSDGK